MSRPKFSWCHMHPLIRLEDQEVSCAPLDLWYFINFGFARNSSPNTHNDSKWCRIPTRLGSYCRHSTYGEIIGYIVEDSTAKETEVVSNGDLCEQLHA